ncbi:MAG: acylphosphatase [Spirochaetaceae bacterium]|jgi:acylphosphatase|nr:acylphosphatase [Spirochaetaceae bacterium]
MPDKSFYARVSGRVQGVGFRFKAKEEADKYGLGGWVRNLDSGEVEVYAEGGEEHLTRFLAWLHHGPPWAHVESVEIQWQEAPLSKRGKTSFKIGY